MAQLFELFDQTIAEQLGVDTQKYIDTIEEFNDEDMEFIVFTTLDPKKSSEEKQKARELFNTKLQPE